MKSDHRAIANPESEPESQRDAGVLWVAWALGWLQFGLNLPRWLLEFPGGRLAQREASVWIGELRPPKARVGPYFNYFYVAGFWLPVVVGAYVGIGYVDRQSAWAWLLAAVVLWRFLEIIVWYLKLLIDQTHRFLISAERNLLFLSTDAFVAVTTTATLLRLAKESSSLVPAWVDGLGVLTLNGRPAGYAGGWADGATVVGTLLGVALIGAGLALLVGLIQSKFKPGPFAYTGPMRIARPRRRIDQTTTNSDEAAST
jgi:hypothetical protein